MKWLALAGLVMFLAPLAVGASVSVPGPLTRVTETIAAPTEHEIIQVDVFENAKELGDQLYLVQYNLDFAADPTEGNISALFLGRLFNGATELGAVAPYSYYGNGFDAGAFALYFTAAQVTSLGMTWNPAVSYTVTFSGNPSYTWTGGIPSVSNNSFVWHDSDSVAASSVQIGVRVRVLAAALESLWTGQDLIETVSGVLVLTAAGEAYFANVIPDLRTMVPDLFAASTTQPVFEEQVHPTTYGDTLAGRLIGTPFDFTDLGNNWGLSRLWTSTIVWLVGCGLLAYGISRATNSYKPILMGFLLPLPFGGLMGFVRIEIALIAGLFLAFYLIVMVKEMVT